MTDAAATLDDIRTRAVRCPSSSAQVSDETLVLLAVLDRLDAVLKLASSPPILFNPATGDVDIADLRPGPVSYVQSGEGALVEPVSGVVVVVVDDVIVHFGEADDSALEDLK